MRTREDILRDIEHHTEWADKHTKKAEFSTKEAGRHTKMAEKAKQELKQFDEANK